MATENVPRRNGIPNVGNTCYISSVIQMLASSCHIQKRFINGRFGESPTHHAMQQLLKMIIDDTSDIYTVETFIQILSQHQKCNLYLKSQNDAHEFYIQLLDVLSDECQQAPSKNNAVIMKYPLVPKKSKLCFEMEKQWQRYCSNCHDRNNMSMDCLVTGQIVNQVKCGQCKTPSHSSDVFTTLSLTIPAGNDISIADCMIHTFRDETIDSGWRCDVCHKVASPDNPAVKSFRIWRLPRTLVISLQRFDFQGNKIRQKVAPVEELHFWKWTCKISPHCSKEIMALKSIVIHHGSTSMGHYTNMSKSHSGGWYMIDDDSIASVNDVSNALETPTAAAYMLLYE